MKKPENNAILMVHSAGAGKTFTTVNAVVELQKLKPNVHVTIIAPKPDLITWQLECLRFKIKNVDYISFAYLANNPTEFFRLCQDGIVIIDEVHNLRSEIERFHYSKTRIVKFLKSKNFSEEIIGDLFANFQVEELVAMTKIPKELVFTPIDGASAYFDGSCAMFSWKMFLLTSTPVVNSHTDLNNIIKMLSRGTIPPLADETTLSRTDETLSQLPISYFNAEKTKITGFPDYIFEDVLVELTPKQRMKYDQIYEGPQYKEQWFKGVPLLGILTSILSGGGNVELGAYYSPKLNFIKDVLLEEKTKSVIYSKWLGKGMEQALDFFKRAIPELADLEGRIMGVTGRTPNADQAKIIKEFNKDESFKILIISGISPREGLNLKGTLKGTRNMFLLEPGWDSAAEAQALPIAIRYQSHSHLPYKQQNCHVYRLLNDDTIDVVLQKTFVERKKKITDVIAQILKKYSI
jgi:SNF2 family DNA or RNA helicase